MMSKLLLRSVMASLTLFGAAISFAACGGGGAIGDACTKEGDTSECASDALCAKNTSGVLQCLQICADQKDCPSNANCTGTTGSDKVCQPK
jgi:hypothetical protein